MRNALLVLASLAAMAFAGCASSSSNPWATPDSKPAPKAKASAPAPSATPTASDALFADDAEIAAAQPALAAEAPAAAPSEEILAEFPAIRRTNLEKALKALKATASVEELAVPEKGSARITRYNAQVGVIEFITPNTYSIGDHVVLTKENKAALVTVIEIDGNRIVADLAAGVKGAPVLKAADHVLCDIYRTPEELEAIAAQQRKARAEALAAQRAAMAAERAVLAGEDDDASADDEGEEEASGDEEESDDSGDGDEDEDW